ncbi:IS21 family transposase [Pseudonocardia sp. C8]|uniref:IS21 family transposase n=1 Tax=Pseudonocardia sp. C8 TaxID=2762759 RepID=UPI001642837C|nr:IS21 family transposase [Pseudonocardia sp. C8]MBC3189503.1 IS21 family transposase [Pseudonocardia sp. C8]MBC3190973.1 IS21 family transposase [Pseudonocardia sp. C8]
MSYREVSVIEVKEILRLWLDGQSLRAVTTLAGVDRKTVRRYVEAGKAAGLDRDGGPGQLTDELLGTVVAAVRPARPRGTGTSWEIIAGERERIAGWLGDGLSLVKVHVLLERRGVTVPYRTLHRFAVAELGFGRRRATVPVVDGEPGVEVQVDFGRLGLIPDPARGNRRVTHGLIFTAVYSRHLFVFPAHRQTQDEVIAGFDAAWAFFGGVFAVVIPDNLAPVVDRADALFPRFNDAFREYAQHRGFAIDPTRVRHPQDKPRVERAVQYVRGNFFAGEQFVDLADCRARAVHWCTHVAGRRIHGSTRARPGEVFAAEEAPLLGPAPSAPFAVPSFTRPKVARDRHVEVARGLYSVPGELIGQRILARADANTVKLYHRGQLLKVHPRQAPGRRHTDPADLPTEVSAYALRDLDGLARRAETYGPNVGAFAAAVLEHPLPWTKMRQVYRLLGLARRHGAQDLDTACARALEVEVINVGLIERMLARGLHHQQGDDQHREGAGPAATGDAGATGSVVPAAGRFVRDADEFSTNSSSRRPS